MPLLEVNESAKRLAAALVKAAALSERATEDALHIALAARAWNGLSADVEL
jgi:hypothetical protein